MSSEKITTGKAPKPVGLYPHARKVGNLLFLSGIGPRKPGTNEIPGNVYDESGKLTAYDFEAQCHSVFENIKIVLEESGAKWENLVDVTVFLTNTKGDFPTMNKLYAEYFKDSLPCRTTVEILSLPTAIAIELKCIAVV